MLKLNGKAFVLNAPPPAVQKLKALLLRAPKDEVFSSTELCRKYQIGGRTLDRAIHELADMTRRWKDKRIWGHPLAIKAFDKETQ